MVEQLLCGRYPWLWKELGFEVPSNPNSDLIPLDRDSNVDVSGAGSTAPVSPMSVRYFHFPAVFEVNSLGLEQFLLALCQSLMLQGHCQALPEQKHFVFLKNLPNLCCSFNSSSVPCEQGQDWS